MAGALAQRLARFSKRFPALYPTDNSTAIQRVGMRHNWWSGVIASISGSFYGDFVTLYLLALGASAASIGVRSSINSAAALAGPLVGAWLVMRTGKRKRWILLWPGGVSRLCILLTALIPFVFQGDAAVTAFVVLVSVQAFSDALSGPPGNSLLGDIIPAPIRGRYLGAQMVINSAMRMAIVPLTGWMIRQVGGLSGYQTAWFLAAIVGFWSTWVYSWMPEPPSMETQEGQGFWSGFLHGWQILAHDRRFMAFCITNFVWNFGIQMAGPFFTVHMASDLHFTVDTIAVITTVSAIVNTIMYRIAGELVDRQGAQRMTLISMLTVPLLPVLWIFATTPFQVGLVQAYGQIAWAGFQVAATPLILMISPPAHRSSYIANFNTVNSIALIIAPILAGWIYGHWGFNYCLIFSAIGRAAGGLGFLWLLKVNGLRAIHGEEYAVRKAVG